MIPVSIDTDRFRYDIHSLVKAFCPGEEVRVCTAAEWDERGGLPDVASVPFLIVIRLGDDSAPDMTIQLIRGDELRTRRGSWSPVRGSGAELSTNGTDGSELTQKNVLKKLLYELLSEQLGHGLPWGSLTGIRPTRIPMQMMDAWRGDDEIHTYLRDIFNVSDEKRALAIEIAHRERAALSFLEDGQDRGFSLYIGIPFCPTRCLYCSFTSYPYASWADRTGDYIDCVGRELELAADIFAGRRLTTVYVGGGTPTTLQPHELTRLLDMVYSRFDMDGCRELTVEAGRPDSLDVERLRAMKRMGVTRISVNPQTMNDETLVRIGRRHTVSQTIEAYELARSEGFDDINMDLILGLPGEGEREVRRTMEEIGRLRPDDLTIHALAVKRGSRLHEQLLSARGTEETAPGEDKLSSDEADRLMHIASEGARSMGLSPYYLYRQKNMTGNLENTGYAAPGHEGLYNILIMEELQDIVAVGAGTVSKKSAMTALIFGLIALGITVALTLTIYKHWEYLMPA